ncbi:MAG: hypothetical protein ACTHMU_19015 [Thermomicrobiales bacterium]
MTRRFQLFRHQDVSGVSGTGIVADGVEFPNGWVALVWRDNLCSMNFIFCMSDVERIHGHGGKTEIIWID